MLINHFPYEPLIEMLGHITPSLSDLLRCRMPENAHFSGDIYLNYSFYQGDREDECRVQDFEVVISSLGQLRNVTEYITHWTGGETVDHQAEPLYYDYAATKLLLAGLPDTGMRRLENPNRHADTVKFIEDLRDHGICDVDPDYLESLEALVPNSS